MSNLLFAKTIDDLINQGLLLERESFRESESININLLEKTIKISDGGDERDYFLGEFSFKSKDDRNDLTLNPEFRDRVDFSIDFSIYDYNRDTRERFLAAQFLSLGVSESSSSFPNGVASGDITSETGIIWARTTVLGNVTLEYSTDAEFNSILGSQSAIALDPNLPLKFKLTGLTSATEYFYRVIDRTGASVNGRFLTAAELGTYQGLHFGVSGDWRGELSPYPSISNVPEKQLDFFVELGDTIYADVPSPAVVNPDGTEKEQAETLAEFRAKHAEVYGERYGLNTWAALRASTSILATIDDHEVTNDFAGGEPAFTDAFNEGNSTGESRFGNSLQPINDTELYENGLQAFQEYNPIGDQFYGDTGDSRTAGERQLYRYRNYGSDAAVMVLDNRSFRDRPLPLATTAEEIEQFLTLSLTLDRTMLGEAQLEDLKQDLLTAEASGITWKFVVIPEPIQNLSPIYAQDRYEGYAKERTEILSFINENGIDNVVFIAADIHVTVVNNLTYQEVPDGEQIATTAWEITTGPVAYAPPTPLTKSLIDKALEPFGYDPVGLDDNLAIADGLIDATLLQGGYVVSGVYGWTEFFIDPESQKLTVTTYGIRPYNEEQLNRNPEEVTSRVPIIRSQFEVNPTEVIQGTAQGDVLTGTDFNDVITGFAGNDRLRGGKGRDRFVYESLEDIGDRIEDFEIGQDKIVLSELLDNLGYTGADPISDSYIQFQVEDNNGIITIDPDSIGILAPQSAIAVANVTIDELNNPNNFVF